MADLERFLSKRYLFSGERKALLAAITSIAVSGVAIGVAALIIVIGVMDGAQEELFGKMLSIYPHIKVMASNEKEIESPAEVIAAAKTLPEVVEAKAIVGQQGLLRAIGTSQEGQLVAAQLMSLEDVEKNPIYPLKSKPPGTPLKLGDNEVILGSPLATKLGVKPGDRVIVITQLPTQSVNRDRPSLPLIVSGIFDTGYYAFDSLTAFISPETARDGLGTKGKADYVHVKLKEPFKSREVAMQLQKALPSAYVVHSWENEDQGFFLQSLKVQKAALFLILMLIVLVAGLNIIGTLILMVIDKTREVGILKAIGASNGTVRMTFVNSGMLIGLLGTSAGVVFGLIGCFLLKNVIKLDMPPSVYNFQHLPVVVKFGTVGFIVLSVMVVCFISSLIPAAQAARLDPVEALRHE